MNATDVEHRMEEIMMEAHRLREQCTHVDAQGATAIVRGFCRACLKTERQILQELTGRVIVSAGARGRPS